MRKHSKLLITTIFVILSIVVCLAAAYAGSVEEEEKAITEENDKIINFTDNSTNITNITNVTNIEDIDNITDSVNTTNHGGNITNYTTNYTDDNGDERSTNISTITVHMMPSVDTGLEYKNYTRTWVNYCPFCHKNGTLTDTPKDTSRSSTVPEGEITCDMALGGCDADFDGVSGKDKLWRDVYLTPDDGYQIIEYDNGSFILENNGLNQKQNIRNAQISILESENF